MEKFILTISPDYVKHWTPKDGIREFIQNAIDQETAHKDNKAVIKPSNGCLIIENNNSVLKKSTLLMGGGDKANNSDMIGGFGEGYKVALLVLIREGFKVHIANYGSGELWEPEIIHSIQYESDVLSLSIKELKHGKDLERGVSIIITHDNFDFNSTIEDIYLKYREPIIVAEDYKGNQLLDKSNESGNIYIGNLFISHSTELKYGYNFTPGTIEIGRDRNITDTFTIRCRACNIIKGAKDEFVEQIKEDLKNNIKDFNLVEGHDLPDTISKLVAEEYQDKQVISDNSDKQALEDSGIAVKNPEVVHGAIKSVVWQKQAHNKSEPIKRKSAKQLLGEFIEKYKDELNEEMKEELNKIYER